MTDSLPPILKLCPDAGQLVAGLSERISDLLAAAIADRGEASFVTSGGSTPGVLYDVLSRAPLDWSKVQLTASDERWVAKGAEGSNEKLVHERLMQGPAAAARYISLRTDHDTPAEGEAESHARIAAMPRPFDVTLVGMGPDSHTASLYPHADGLDRAIDLDRPGLTAAMSPKAAEGSNQRLTLTLRALLDSRLIIILIRGEDKLAVYRAALAGTDVSEAPVRALIHQTTAPVEVWWAP
jgi:6-phosphogluconolactonase